jgi:hypothetical protein
MFGILKAWCAGTNLTADILEFYRIQRFPALIALVAPGIWKATARAGAHHIPVCQEALAFRAVGLQHGILVNVAMVQQREEHILCYLGVVFRPGGSKQVE